MTNPAAERYSRQVLLKEWGEAGQRALSEAHFVVIGAGGIGMCRKVGHDEAVGRAVAFYDI